MSPRLLSAALDAIGSGVLDAQSVVVFCNKEAGEDAGSDAFCEQVESAGLPLVRVSDQRFRRERGGEPARKGQPLPEWRKAYDLAVLDALSTFDFDIGVLAGYKLIFGEEPCRRWDLLNLHPAAPGGPAGVWQDVIWTLLESEADEAGVMMHLATPELDEGPVVTYCTYPIKGTGFDAARAAWDGERDETAPIFRAIRAAGVAREVPLVIETLKALADERVRIVDKAIVGPAGSRLPGFDLSTEIETALA
jgi:folate-dependent phosphoribosylglycinamide formyltransferase PurN